MAGKTMELPIIEYSTQKGVEDWLEDRHEEADGVWVKIAKAGTDIESVSFDQALDAALCFGWIDGVRREFSREYYLQKFAPRDSSSAWSWIECDKAEWLIEQNRMRPAGMAQVEAAKRDGRWETAQAKRGEIEIPTDLKARLASYPTAKAFFDTLDDRNRNAILYRLDGPGNREARNLRLNQIIDMLENQDKPY